jgi:putative flavoprotein involved in K+ transport
VAISSEVKLVGRFAGVNSGKVRFSGSLRNVCELSDLKMDRLLDSIDAWAEAHDVEGEGELT